MVLNCISDIIISYFPLYYKNIMFDAGEIICVHCKIHALHTTRHCVENAEVFNITLENTYNNHGKFKGLGIFLRWGRICCFLEYQLTFEDTVQTAASLFSFGLVLCLKLRLFCLPFQKPVSLLMFWRESLELTSSKHISIF